MAGTAGEAVACAPGLRRLRPGVRSGIPQAPSLRRKLGRASWGPPKPKSATAPRPPGPPQATDRGRIYPKGFAPCRLPPEERLETRYQRPEYGVWGCGGSCSLFGSEMEGRGMHFRFKLGVFEGMLAARWGVLGLLWAILAPSWRSWGHLGLKLGGLGGILAPSWEVLGASCLQVVGLGGILAASWGFLGGCGLQVGRSWGHLGCKLGVLGTMLG